MRTIKTESVKIDTYVTYVNKGLQLIKITIMDCLKNEMTATEYYTRKGIDADLIPLDANQYNLLINTKALMNDIRSWKDNNN